LIPLSDGETAVAAGMNSGFDSLAIYLVGLRVSSADRAIARNIPANIIAWTG